MTAKGLALVVDDEPELRDSLAFELRQLGLDVREAANGVEALVMLSSQTFAVIVSDVMMPEMNGIELLRALRQWHVTTPFIIVSGFATRDLTLEALRLGAFDFIDKPFRSEVVATVVKEAVDAASRSAAVLKQAGSLEEARDQIIQMKMLRFAPVNGSGDARQHLIEEFLTEACGQMQFAKASFAGLADGSSADLSYLFRLTRTLRLAAEGLCFTTFAASLWILEEVYAAAHVGDRRLSADVTGACERVHDALMAFLKDKNPRTLDDALHDDKAMPFPAEARAALDLLMKVTPSLMTGPKAAG